MNESISEKEKTIISDFSGINKKKLLSLIPFEENDLWGLLDPKTLEIKVNPKYDYLSLFKPNMIGSFSGPISEEESFDGISFYINKEGKLIINKSEDDKEMLVKILERENRFKNITIISSKNGYKGFKVDKNGSLIGYSDIYHVDLDFPSSNVYPVKKGKNVYAIAIDKKTGKYGVIDTLGNVLEGFNFNYQAIRVNTYAKDKNNIWFFIKEDNNFWSLKDEKGNLKLKNKIIAYPLTSDNLFGYTVLRTDTSSEVIDLYNMKLLVEPQNKMIYESLYYSSKRELNTNNPKDRKDATMYYQIYSQNLTRDKSSRYFMNFKGQIFLPKKNEN